ncbi:MAG: chemotaxis protein CheW [Spirochaetales bacterium]|nr:chemotaxis protein CheW [Spirochaetales bacterium]
MSVAEKVKSFQCLTFTLGDEVFAVDIMKIQQILDFTRITKVPKTPDFMRGVINLRGSVVPVVDLRLKFGMEQTEQSIDTCIIVMEISFGKETTVLGALADSVQEVIELEPDQIEEVPKIGTTLNTEFIKGMGKKGESFIIILDIDSVFSDSEIDTVKSVKAQAEGIREEDSGKK